MVAKSGNTTYVFRIPYNSDSAQLEAHQSQVLKENQLEGRSEGLVVFIVDYAKAAA